MSNSPGIYTIKNLVNNKVYVGSAINLRKRKNNHWNYLQRNIHYNKKLQNAFNKYGKENFIFEIVEDVKYKNSLTEAEQFWIDSYDAVNDGYNIAPTARSMLGFKFSEEQKEKLSQSHLGIKPSKESIAKSSASRRGMIVSEETRNKISIKNKGRKLTPEQKSKLIISMKNSQAVQNHIKKLIDMGKGRKPSKETRKKLSHSQKKRSEERLRKGELVGAVWDKEKKLWQAKIKIKGKTTFLGRYKTAEEAHQIYLVARSCV